ncbi:hypothetical protein BN381_430011 [Candidatus Microthrix parvicella RN1]|uniref:Uncharacterized protein n=1 Tax=Candidatus Neomicrothrix parvicella RN1 TaxID=1229780 RepID=R4Z1R2_9ACTN|nr:hypothetical protein BN381_430011 [Candidatus Microthrix parvicella RN1]
MPTCRSSAVGSTSRTGAEQSGQGPTAPRRRVDPGGSALPRSFAGTQLHEAGALCLVVGDDCGKRLDGRSALPTPVMGKNQLPLPRYGCPGKDPAAVANLPVLGVDVPPHQAKALLLGRPQRVVIERAVRRPGALHRACTKQIVDHLGRVGQLCLPRSGSQRLQVFVVHRVTADREAGIGDHPGIGGTLLDVHSQEEEGGRYLLLFQDRQDLGGVLRGPVVERQGHHRSLLRLEHRHRHKVMYLGTGQRGRSVPDATFRQDGRLDRPLLLLSQTFFLGLPCQLLGPKDERLCNRAADEGLRRRFGELAEHRRRRHRRQGGQHRLRTAGHFSASVRLSDAPPSSGAQRHHDDADKRHFDCKQGAVIGSSQLGWALLNARPGHSLVPRGSRPAQHAEHNGVAGGVQLGCTYPTRQHGAQSAMPWGHRSQQASPLIPGPGVSPQTTIDVALHAKTGVPGE